MGCTLFSLALLLSADQQHAAPLVGGDEVKGLALDADGNLYIAGVFDTAYDFNGLAGVEDSRTPVGDDTFVTRINRDGSYAWTQVVSGAGNDFARAIATDGTSVFVCLTTTSNAIAIGGTASGNNGFDSGFVVALDAATGAARTGFAANGVARVDGGGGTDRVLLTSLLVFGTKLFVGGYANGGVQVNQTAPLISLRNRDGIVVALDTTTGQRVTSFSEDGVQSFGGNGAAAVDQITALALDSNFSRLYAAGSFAGTSAGVSGATGITAPSGASDAFVISLDATSGAVNTSFSGDGAQIISGGAADQVTTLSIASDILFVGGQTTSDQLGIGATAGAAGASSTKAFLSALLASGAAQTTFNGGTTIAELNFETLTAGVVATHETVLWALTAENGQMRLSSEPGVLFPGCAGTGQQVYVLPLDRTARHKPVLGVNGFLHLCSPTTSSGTIGRAAVAGAGALHVGGMTLSSIASVTSALDGIGPATPVGGVQAWVVKIGAETGPRGADGANGSNGSNGTNGVDGTNGANGANGTNGSNGTSALITTISEPAGATCPSGGTKINVGNDKNGNGALDVEEITQTQTICNGAAGKGGCAQTQAAPWIAIALLALVRRRRQRK